MYFETHCESLPNYFPSLLSATVMFKFMFSISAFTFMFLLPTYVSYKGPLKPHMAAQGHICPLAHVVVRCLNVKDYFEKKLKYKPKGKKKLKIYKEG